MDERITKIHNKTTHNAKDCAKRTTQHTEDELIFYMTLKLYSLFRALKIKQCR